MAELGRFARELRARLWKPSVDEEVRSELSYHLELLEQQLIAEGLSPDAARAQARARFGNVSRIGHACRDIGLGRDREQRRGRWLAELRQDVGYAIRQLRASPRFAAVAIITLAVGLGASTTIFGIADAVILRPLPFREPDRLVIANAQTPAGMAFSPSQPDFLDWRARARRFEEMAGFEGRTPNVTGDGGPEQLVGSAVSRGFFRVFGVGPAMGRGFAVEEDQLGGDTLVAVISHTLWQRRFASDPRVLERSIDLDGVRRRIIGVMPRGFDFPGQVDVWTPLAPSYEWPRADHRLDGVVARLAPGATLLQGRRELVDVARQLATEYPASNAEWSVQVNPFVEWYVSPDMRARLLTLLATVGLLLAMACVNVASLLLARAGARERQMALRAALGAGRGRIIRQLLTESVVLSLLGGGVGLALAAAAVPIVRRTGTKVVPLLADMHLDWRVLGFAFVACVVTGLLFGLAPAFRLARGAMPTRADRGGGLHHLLRSGTRVADAGRVRSMLIVSSVALATLLLVCAGLIGGSFLRLMRVDLGFTTDHVLTGSIVLPADRYDRERITTFTNELVQRVRALPGVRAVGTTNIAPFSGGNTAMGWAVPGHEPATRSAYPTASWRIVSAGYFPTLGIALKRGHLFEGTERRGEPRVTVVSEGLAQAAWPNEDPVGRRLLLGNGQSITVVGVVNDVRALNVDSAPRPTMYFPNTQFSFATLWLTVRTSGDPRAIEGAVRRELARLDPALPLAQVQPLANLFATATAQPRLTVLVFGIFAAAALTLAAVGLYGLVSFGVAQRTREIGVQLALGAQRGRIVRAIVGQGLRLAAIGVTLGTLVAFGAVGALRSILYETEPTSPATFAAVAALLLTVAALASAAPARRASRLDPAATLRAE
jgi:putative ABC transport system permease protein